MENRAVRAQSFGAVADDYDRLRPSAAPEAVEWLVPHGCRTAIDLAAGTGLFTRELLRWVPTVIAVEPDDRMRAVLVSRSPSVQAVSGVGEAIPLPDGSADALFISSAWHWMDPPRAVPEIARVLRPGGRLGIIWTSRDRALPWIAELDVLEREAADGVQHEPRGGQRRVDLPEGSGFGEPERAEFGYVRRMTPADAVGMFATYSGIITLAADKREKRLEPVRAKVAARTGADGLVDVPVKSWCWRAELS